MKKGGYQIINIPYDFTLTTAATIAGVYSQIENCNGKACLLSGVSIGGTKVKDVFVLFVAGTNKYTATFLHNSTIYVIEVTKTNAITVTEGEYTTATNATTTTAGLVLKAALQSDAVEAASTPTKAEFNAVVGVINSLIDKLQAAGLMATT